MGRMFEKMEEDGNQTIFLVFDSVADQTRFLRKRTESWDDTVVKFSDSDFVGRRFRDSEDAFRAVERPWSEGLHYIDEMVALLSDVDIPEIKSRKRKSEFSDNEDGDFDFERYQEGDPNHFRESSREAGHDTFGIVTIWADMTTAFNVGPKEALWRCAAAIALASFFEEKGYQTEIWGVNGTNGVFTDGDNGFFATKTKSPEDPFDLGTLSSTMSTWFYRTACFSTFVQTADMKECDTVDGLGVVRNVTEDDLDEIQIDEHRIFISGCFSEHGAVDVVESEIRKLVDRQKQDNQDD